MKKSSSECLSALKYRKYHKDESGKHLLTGGIEGVAIDKIKTGNYQTTEDNKILTTAATMIGVVEINIS